MKVRMILFAQAVGRFMNRYRVLLGALLAAGLAGALALYNISSGPLRNLNDIGGWSNRALFIALSAAVHGATMLLCVCVSQVRFPRIALRQVILTAGFYIMLLGINHKTYHYINVMQPVIRAMDTGGLAAGTAMDANLSAPALLVTYLITRGPVYDMYLLKLFAVGCYLTLAVLTVRFADRRNLGIRSEVLLALCMILPQGFTNAACSALLDVFAVSLLGVSLMFTFDMDKPKTAASAICYGFACAISGACLYMLPAYVLLAAKGRMKKRWLAAVAGVMLLLCIPAMVAGMKPLQALGSLLNANFGLPAYASGAPGLMNLVPRAIVEEMPQYAPILRHFDELDTVTHAQPYYTHAHFTQMASGMILVSLAFAMGMWALILRMKDRSTLHRLLTLALGLMIACPNTTSGAWLIVDLLCLYALLAAPKLRIPACMVLFATACSSVYPMTEEVMLPMIYAFALCLLALLMLTGVIPMNQEDGEEKAHE